MDFKIKSSIFAIAFLLISITGFCKTNTEIAIKNINPKLLKNANSIVRSQTINVLVKAIGDVEIEVEQIITILNEKANNEGILRVHHDKFSKVKHVKAVLYDENGTVIKHINDDEILDVLYVNDMSAITDERATIASFEYGGYPYTVKYSYQIKYTGYFSYLNELLINYHQSCENFLVKITEPESLKSKTVIDNISCKTITDTIIKGNRIRSYNFENISAIPEQENTFQARYILPKIQVVPTNFILNETQGSFNSWQEFGKWIYNLNSSTCNLSSSSKQQIIDLCKNANSEHQKIKLLYKYLQQNCRYINVSLGIGGLKSVDAEQTHRVKYGDCKSLSTYMKSMLEAVGIKSNLVIIKSGAAIKNFKTDFVSNQFDHVILCVPQPNDTVWLECTSAHLPFNVLGSFTENRTALMITETGGYLINTPTTSQFQNSRNTKTEIKIGVNSIDCNAKIKSTGDEIETLKWLNENHKNASNKPLLKILFGINDFEISNLDESIEKSETAFLIELKLKNSNKNWFKNDRCFLPTTLFKWDELNTVLMGRDTIQTIKFEHICTYSDTINYTFSADYSLESINKNQTNLANEVFSFNQNIVANIQSHSVQIINKFELLKTEIEPSKITSLFKQIKALQSICNQNIVVSKI